MIPGTCPMNVGDRITWTIMDNCGKCYYCREKGLMMKCRHLKKYGHDSCEKPPHFEGGLLEAMPCQWQWLYDHGRVRWYGRYSGR